MGIYFIFLNLPFLIQVNTKQIKHNLKQKYAAENTLK